MNRETSPNREIRLGIIGLGLIGGSLGLALRPARGWEVVGYDERDAVRQRAVEMGVCDAVFDSPEGLARNSDAVLIAVPSGRIVETALLAARHMRRGTVLTDVGSVKLPLQTGIAEGLPPGVRYVGGHPMAGSERSGLAAARPDLFKGAVWALTVRHATVEAVETVKAMVRTAGAEPLVVDALDHDRSVAFVSHLPYIVAVALASCVEGADGDLPLVRHLVAGGFKDGTRVANSDPVVAMDYCRLNARHLLAAVNEFEGHLEQLKAALRECDDRGLVSKAERAREYLAMLGGGGVRD
ncbi:MAG: prephenate dehydrogenase/arogenate dehydrogenase family protein [Firmicutes bacterium]|nr:prephenate dehydrogenase/arogenate dehydrogenase family protein [Bacillota bacterium]